MVKRKRKKKPAKRARTRYQRFVDALIVTTARVMVDTARSLGCELVWISERDTKVCAECWLNDEESPYQPGEEPDLPAHPNCRCSLKPFVGL